MKNKRFSLYLIFTILCMFLIFNFSNKNAAKSNSTSKTLINNGIIVYEKVFHKDLDNEKIIKKLNYPVRKVAHYSIYFILGILIYNFLLTTNLKRKELISILICFLYATLDEFHQLFISGRTGQLKDILIDTSGALTAIILLRYIKKVKLKNKRVKVAQDKKLCYIKLK